MNWTELEVVVPELGMNREIARNMRGREPLYIQVSVLLVYKNRRHAEECSEGGCMT
jgi:hypothetical protein